jgi:cytochrome c oxidase subunit 4
MAASAPRHPARRLWIKAGIVWLALALLLALTWFAAYQDLGPWKLPVSLGIAGAKAGLVIVVFMELLQAVASPRLAALAGLLWLALMIGLAMADYGTRARLAPGFGPAPPSAVAPPDG